MKGRFENFVKAFCICAILYIYIFILSDILGLNPNDDGDIAGFGKIFGFFPALSAILYLLLDKTGGGMRNMKKILLGLSIGLAVIVSLFFLLKNFEDGFSEMIILLVTFVTLGIMPIIPVAVYLIYKKTRDKTSFILLALAMCILGLSLYPAKDYIQASFSGDPCATKKLLVKQYSGDPIEYQEVQGDVVCIAVDRGYPSETFKWQVFEGVNANTFEYLGDGYSRDKDTVFYQAVATEADPKTFEIDPEWQADQMTNFIRGGTSYKKDGKNVYYEGKKLSVKDISKFQIIDFCDSYLCATDGTSVFKEGTVVQGVNLNYLKLFHSCEYAKDDKRAYYGGEVMEDVDVDTFNVWNGDKYCYSYDAYHMYYKGVRVPEATPDTFKQIQPGDPFAPDTDGKNIYYEGKRLDLDIKSFQYLGKGVSKDANSVYHGADKIEEADAATFELVPISMPNVMSVCAKDKNHSYFDGEVGDHPVCTGETF